jgi:putative two-component system response regulator
MENLSYSPPNVLIVDDVNANLVTLSEIIRNAGYIARPVTSARQAVNAIEALAPSLILMDISMPEIDGLVFCSMLKKNTNTRDIPVIFISALNSTENIIKGFRAGAVDFISKPFAAEEVILRINTHLKMYRMNQELEQYNKNLYKIINDQIRKLYEEQKNVVNALIILAEKRDSTKAAHLDYVGKNSKILAMSLQMSPIFRGQITNSFIDAIELAAPLHDIGKIIISDDILYKKELLLPEEASVLETHTTAGAALLEEIYSMNPKNEFIKLAIDIARNHHEKWDGTGYPNKTGGAAIPLCARIVAIVNEYDLLINKTDCGQNYSLESCMGIINMKSGSDFDPDIVTVFHKIQNQLKR